ncbi:MAG: type I-B CRISPR-associated endonuclease Cas1b [Cetobacterium sp.]|uniref:type I-B CRISPR-associated endonuclease Cas1b n=1 Tax=Cetobacterium sp. TaxID=2071632 RepID=UPI002FCB0A32
MSESYYLFSNGDLKRKDNVLRMTNSEGKFKDLKIEMSRDIYLFGEVSLNTKCLNYMGQLNIPMHLFNYYGYYTGSFYPKEVNVSGKLLIKQVSFYTDEEKRLELAKEFIRGAAHNIFRNLRYYNERDRDISVSMDKIKDLELKLDGVKSINELMGIEGNIRKVYYDEWNTIVNQEISFDKRVKHPPDNMINSLISFVNSLIYVSCLTEIYKTQLNPTISYLHSAGERRFSLCLDLAEIFKPLIGDRMIFSLLNKNIITEDDFEKESNFFYLKDKSRAKILKEYDERLKKTLNHKELKREISYRHLIKLECYKLIKHLMEEKKYESFKIWW